MLGSAPGSEECCGKRLEEGVKSRLRGSASGPWVVDLQFTLLGDGHILAREGVQSGPRKFIICVIIRELSGLSLVGVGFLRCHWNKHFQRTPRENEMR